MIEHVIEKGQNWKDKKVLVLGAARQGLALTRFLAGRGAVVTLNDKRSEDQLVKEQEALSGLAVHWCLGDHPLTLLDDIDMVCVSGGVPLTLPIVEEALRRNIVVTNDSQIFMEAVPCRVVGITGSAGKTTTTTLVGRIAKAAVDHFGSSMDGIPHKVWVGGNIGLPLVEYLDQMQEDDLVILELSSFQLELMSRSPQVGAILNITPNHLDRHGTFEAYMAAKERLLAFQHEKDVAVLGVEDEMARSLIETTVRGGLITFGFECPPVGVVGTFLQGDELAFWDGEKARVFLSCQAVKLRGKHNLLNILAAAAIIYAAGLPLEAVAMGVEGFGGVPHRLEYVRELHGAKWYNDSIATAPERTMAAVRSYDEPIVLLLGGKDKDLPWDELAELVHQRVDHVVIFGAAREKISRAIGDVVPGHRLESVAYCEKLEDAVQEAAKVAAAGDVVLLSPGGTSYDAFRDFEERGECFRTWVHQLQ